jgi:hypothetical protein
MFQFSVVAHERVPVRINKGYLHKPMPTTTHTHQPLKPGAQTVAVDHDHYGAVEYEFYIPAAVWDHSATWSFIQWLQALEPGATIFKGATGVWLGQLEDSYIYRMIPRDGRYDRTNVRDALHAEIGSWHAKLATWIESAQQAILFTEIEIRATLSTRR